MLLKHRTTCKTSQPVNAPLENAVNLFPSTFRVLMSIYKSVAHSILCLVINNQPPSRIHFTSAPFIPNFLLTLICTQRLGLAAAAAGCGTGDVGLAYPPRCRLKDVIIACACVVAFLACQKLSLLVSPDIPVHHVPVSPLRLEQGFVSSLFKL